MNTSESSDEDNIARLRRERREVEDRRALEQRAEAERQARQKEHDAAVEAAGRKCGEQWGLSSNFEQLERTIKCLVELDRASSNSSMTDLRTIAERIQEAPDDLFGNTKPESERDWEPLSKGWINGVKSVWTRVNRAS
jgi:hypothetical protein